MERLDSSFGKIYGRLGDLFQQYEVSLSRILNDILTHDQQWLPNQSEFQPISWPSYRLWPSPNNVRFPWIICNGCGMPGNAYPSGHLVPPVQLLRPDSSNLSYLYSTLNLEYPLVLSRFCLVGILHKSPTRLIFIMECKDTIHYYSAILNKRLFLSCKWI